MISEEKANELHCPYSSTYRFDKCYGSLCMAWIHVSETIDSMGNTISVGYCKLIGDI